MRRTDDINVTSISVASNTSATLFLTNATVTRNISSSFPLNNLDVLITDSSASTLLNKTIFATSNNVAANALLVSNTVVNVNGGATPVAGQVLAATGPNAAIFSVPSVPGSTSLYTTVTNLAPGTNVSVQSVPFAVNSVVFVSSRIAADRLNNAADSAAFTIMDCYRKQATNATVIRVNPPVDDTLSYVDPSGWNVLTTGNTTTGSVDILITAAAGNNINCNVATTFYTVSI